MLPYHKKYEHRAVGPSQQRASPSAHFTLGNTEQKGYMQYEGLVRSATKRARQTSTSRDL